MLKFYQSSPEFTGFEESWFNELLQTVDGTILRPAPRNINEESENFQKVYRMLDNIDDPIDIKNGYSPYTNFTEAVEDWLPPLNKKHYSKQEIHKIKEICSQFSFINNNSIYAQMLTIYTGQEYKIDSIRGCCQGDFGHIIYRADADPEQIKWIEALYFGLYDEYIAEDENGETVCGYYVLHSDDAEEVLKDYANGEPFEIYIIDGYVTTPKYKKLA